MILFTENTFSRYSEGTTLTGILYFHRITDRRVCGTPHRNLRMFGELCGDKAVLKVILVTTMWDKMSGDLAPKAKAREEELKSRYWINMIHLGARTQRFENTKKSALGIVSELLLEGVSEQAVLLQEELVDLGRELNETQAGKALYSQLQTALSQQKETIQALQMQVKERNNPQLEAELDTELKRIQAELDKTFSQISELKIGWWRKITLALFGKKATAVSCFALAVITH